MKYSVELNINQKRDIVTKMYASQEHFKKWELGLKKIESTYQEIFDEGAISTLVFEHEGQEMNMKMTILKNNLPDQIDIVYEVPGAYNLCKNHFTDMNGSTSWMMDVEFLFDKEMQIPIERFIEKTKSGMNIFRNYVIEKQNV